MQDHVNGIEDQDQERMVIIQRMSEAARAAKPPVVIEHVEDTLEPFQQENHTLMIKSLDLMAQQLVQQLHQARDNTKATEQMTKTIEQKVLSTIARTKHEVTELHLLGVQTKQAAKLGHEVCAQLASKIDQLMEDQPS